MGNKITFIGGGNMAEGIIRAMLKNSRFYPEQIYVYEIIDSRKEFLVEQYGIKASENVGEAVDDASVVIFAVRPQDAENVSFQLKPFLGESSIFVSICAGITINSFTSWFGEEQKVVRVMPNTLTETQHGFSAMCLSESLLKQELELVDEVFKTIGQVVEIPENMFDRFTAYCCAGPAYLLYLINAMIDAGVRAGFSRKDARAMTIENILGSALKLQQTNLHPFEIIDTMTSPGGVSIEGIYTMNKEGIYGSVMHVVEEAVRRSEELA